MKTNIVVVLAGLALGAGPAVSLAAEDLRVALPQTHELVELEPGVQVIPQFDLEVFYTGGAYWLRTDGAWYTSRRAAASATFTPVDARNVPAALARLPVGSHLHFQPPPELRRSTKVLASVAPPDPDIEVDAGPVKVQSTAAKPAPAPAPAAAAPAKAKASGKAKASTKATARPASKAKPKAKPKGRTRAPPKKGPQAKRLPRRT